MVFAISPRSEDDARSRSNEATRMADRATLRLRNSGWRSSRPKRVRYDGDSRVKVPSLVWRAPLARSETVPPVGSSCCTPREACVEPKVGAASPGGAPENDEL